jgi:hypothetical protein
MTVSKETLLNLIRQEQRKSEEAWGKVEVYKEMLIAVEKGQEVDFDKDYLKYSQKTKDERTGNNKRPEITCQKQN